MVLKPSGLLALLACAVLVAVAAFVLSGGMASKPPASGEQDGQIVPALDKDTAARLARAMDADASLDTWLATCPADAWRRRGDLTRSGAVAAVACAKAPEDCLARCLEFASGRACFALARVVQKTHGLDPLYGEKLYQMACTAGEASGCVNRAAGIRNGNYHADPFAKRPPVEREACQLRGFAIGCDTGDSWGCAMRGQAYARGEGTPADPAAARREFAAACAKDPKFAACGFARERLAEMKAAEADKAESSKAGAGKDR